MYLHETIHSFSPSCEQELHDKCLMLSYMNTFTDLLSRNNKMAHFTASSWIVNPSRTKVLMIHHNIYKSWSWAGGHVDGEENLLMVAIREAREETGLISIDTVSAQPFSLEILPVCAHFRKGEYVSPHLHLNLTYLLEADETQPIRYNADETSAAAWFPVEEAVASSSEPHMQIIYQKLIKQTKTKF